jgi:hypothetical protein
MRGFVEGAYAGDPSVKRLPCALQVNTLSVSPLNPKPLILNPRADQSLWCVHLVPPDQRCETLSVTYPIHIAPRSGGPRHCPNPGFASHRLSITPAEGIAKPRPWRSAPLCGQIGHVLEKNFWLGQHGSNSLVQLAAAPDIVSPMAPISMC